MNKMHYYLQSTADIPKAVQEQILLDCLTDIFRKNPHLNGSVDGESGFGVGPINVQADIAFLGLLKKGGVQSTTDKIFQTEGEGQKPDGTKFDWKISILFVEN